VVKSQIFETYLATEELNIKEIIVVTNSLHRYLFALSGVAFKPKGLNNHSAKLRGKKNIRFNGPERVE